MHSQKSFSRFFRDTSVPNGRIVWELNLCAEQSSQSDIFLYMVGTIIANAQLFTWKKSGSTVCHSLKL